MFIVKETLPDERLISAGQYGNENGHMQGVLLRTTANGDSLWMYSYLYYDSLMLDGRGAFRDVLPTLDGGFIACGYAHSSITGNDPPGYTQDVWVIKVDSMGCLEPGCNLVSIQTQVTNFRDALRLWPNPVSELLTVAWDLPEGLRKGNSCQLSVVSAAGQLVRTETISLATDQHQLDVRNLSPGLYHVHLVSDGTWITGGKFLRAP
ncbi:MAG: T9SS type A sorting domain-containing protein [Flavobacteriales bacterium]|nr:T9SS type A sorting domain-containing protein [Flavobacteriales bacterium]